MGLVEGLHTRDVFSIGVLSLWALSDIRIDNHSDLLPALEEFDAPPEIER